MIEVEIIIKSLWNFNVKSPNKIETTTMITHDVTINHVEVAVVVPTQLLTKPIKTVVIKNPKIAPRKKNATYNKQWKITAPNSPEIIEMSKFQYHSIPKIDCNNK